MKILITGGAGFIGSHLVGYYLARGDEVYVIDDLSTGSLDNIRQYQNDPRVSDRFHFKVGTILEYEAMVDMIGICDLVFHLAAAVGVKYIIENPLNSLITNVRGTDIVLELCNRFRKTVLIASTSEAYGKHTHAPLRESDDCVYGSSDKFRWSYAASKLIDEFSSLAYFRSTKLPVAVVRLFNIIGPRQTGRYGMVVPRFIDQALAGEPITVYGDGTQSRTFTHVREVVDLFARIIQCPKAYGEVVNVGGVEEVTILELAHRIKKLTSSRSEIKLVPYTTAYPKDFEDMARRVPCTDKLRSLVGAAPTLALDSILREIIEDRIKSPVPKAA